MILDLTSAKKINLQRAILNNKLELQKNKEVRPTLAMLIFYMQILENHYNNNDNDQYHKQALIDNINFLLESIEEKVELKFTDLEFEKMDFEYSMSRMQTQQTEERLSSASLLVSNQAQQTEGRLSSASLLVSNMQRGNSVPSLRSLSSLSTSVSTLTSVAHNSQAGYTLTAYLGSVSQANNSRSLEDKRKELLSLREYAEKELTNPWHKIEAAKHRATELAAEISQQQENERKAEEEKRLARLGLEF